MSDIYRIYLRETFYLHRHNIVFRLKLHGANLNVLGVPQKSFINPKFDT